MPKLISNILVLCVVLLLVSSCRTGKEVAGDIKRKSPRFLVERLKNNQHHFEWFNGKGKLKFTSEGKTQSATANIRMRKDSLIWITVSKIGFEAARMQITPDSVHILLRKEKEYYARDYSFFMSEYNLDIDFSTLQQILWGNALLPDTRRFDSNVDPPFHLLTAKDGLYTHEFRLSDKSYLLAQMIVEEPSTKRIFSVDYHNYKAMQEVPYFAYDRNAVFRQNDQPQAELAINFSKVELDTPKSTPFTVSSKYARK